MSTPEPVSMTRHESCVFIWIQGQVGLASPEQYAESRWGVIPQWSTEDLLTRIKGSDYLAGQETRAHGTCFRLTWVGKTLSDYRKTKAEKTVKETDFYICVPVLIVQKSFSINFRNPFSMLDIWNMYKWSPKRLGKRKIHLLLWGTALHQAALYTESHSAGTEGWTRRSVISAKSLIWKMVQSG